MSDFPWALAAIPALAGAYMVFGPKNQNWFEKHGRYEPFNSDFYPPEAAWSSCIRQENLDGELEIIRGRGGVCAEEPYTIPHLFEKIYAENSQKVALGHEVRNESTGQWEMFEITWQQYRKKVHDFGRSLMALGLKQHDVVTVLAHNSMNWLFAKTGAIYSGGVCSGIYPSSLPGAIQYITNHCETRIAFVDTRDQLNKYLEIEGELEFLEHIVVFEDIPLRDISTSRIRVWSLAEFLGAGEKIPRGAVAERMANIRPGHCCLLSYTSGTTGNPKGVMLSHDNVISCIRYYQACAPSVPNFWYNENPPGSVLPGVSYLPMCHVMGMLGGWIGPVYVMNDYDCNCPIYFARRDWQTSLFETVKAVKPARFFGVPRIWEKIAETVQAQVAAASPIKRALFNMAMSRGKYLYDNIQAGGTGEYPFGYGFFQKYVFTNILAALGLDEAQTLGSGGAALSEGTKAFFGGMGHLMGNGYGMTESAGAGSASRPYHFIGSALGIPVPGLEVRVQHDPERDQPGAGEICLRGRPVMMGYLKEPEKTRKAIDEKGWLHTGDVGRFDGPVLYITGRIKELLVTAGGENVAPVPIEQYIESIRPGIGNVIVVGDSKKYLTALVAVLTTVDGTTGDPTNVLMDHAREVNPAVMTVEQAKQDDAWIEYIRSAFDDYNHNSDVCVSNAARIQYFTFLPMMLCQSQETVGPTLKTKRHVVHQIYGDLIESMYQGKGIPVNTRGSKL